MSRYLPDFAGIFCLVFFLICLAMGFDNLLGDGDPFWHIKAGSVMLEQQSLLDRDIFSHTAYGTPWTAHEWLSEIIMAGLHQVAGLEGVLCFFVMIAALSIWLLFRITEKLAQPRVAVVAVALAMFISANHMAARPHLFTWLFMLMTLAILMRGGQWLYWLPILTAIWANLHGGFVLSLVLQSIFITGATLECWLTNRTPLATCLRTQKMPALVLFCTIVAVGLNPFGYELLAFPFHVSKGVFAVVIGEWKSPNLQEMWYFRFYLVALVLLLSFTRSAATWTERLLIVFFLNAALTHVRHVSLMLLILTPFIARMLDNHCKHWHHRFKESEKGQQLQLSPKSGPMLTVTIFLILLIAGANNTRNLAFLAPQKIFRVETEQLHQLTDYLEKHLPAGNMFNEYVLGGYLLYAMHPPPRVFIDGRADMYGEQITTDYGKIVDSSSERAKLLEQYAIDWVVFEKDSNLVHDLEGTGEWQSTFKNEYYAVLIRTVTNNVHYESSD